ncbi:MAG: hypothetical protein ACP5UV_03695 [Thermoplasmata archaeon]
MLNHIYLIPHGDEIVDMEKAEDRIMHESIAKSTKDDRSEIIVVISPHGLILDNNVGVVYTRYLKSYYRTKNRILRRNYENDITLADSICKSERCERVRYTTLSGNTFFNLDFGTVIPLTFFKVKKIVSIGQPRLLPREYVMKFADHLYDVIDSTDEGISIIISADQAHTHSSEGPYGYSEEAGVYDRMVKNAINTSDFSDIIELKDDFINKAKPDSFYNMIILDRLLKKSGKKMKSEYYYVAKYFGMLFAHDI